MKEEELSKALEEELAATKAAVQAEKDTNITIELEKSTIAVDQLQQDLDIKIIELEKTNTIFYKVQKVLKILKDKIEDAKNKKTSTTSTLPEYQCICPAIHDGRGNCNVGAKKNDTEVWCYINQSIENPRLVCPDSRQSG